MNFTNLKNFMDDMTRKFVPGNAASVYYHNREVFRYASGYSDRENGVQMTGDELMFVHQARNRGRGDAAARKGQVPAQ